MASVNRHRSSKYSHSRTKICFPSAEKPLTVSLERFVTSTCNTIAPFAAREKQDRKCDGSQENVTSPVGSTEPGVGETIFACGCSLRDSETTGELDTAMSDRSATGTVATSAGALRRSEGRARVFGRSAVSASFLPHPLQNEARDLFSRPQCGHVIVPLFTTGTAGIHPLPLRPRTV